MPRYAGLEAARLQGRLWTPQQLHPSLVLWWDGWEGPFDEVSGEANAIADRTGRGRTLTATGAITRPGIVSNAIRQRPALQWTTGDDAATGSVALGTLAAFEAVLVLTMSSATQTDGRALSFYATGLEDWNNASSCGIVIRNSSTNAIRTFHNGSQRASTSVSLDTPMVFRVSCNGSTVQHYLNGTAGGSGAMAPTLGTGQFAIGRYQAAATNRWSGYIGEVLFVSGLQPARTGQALEGYLAWRWGLQDSLAASHPYRNAPPLIGA